MKRILVGVLPLFISGMLTLPAHAETLEEAVARAVADHPAVRSAGAAHKQTIDTVREERSGYFPEASASASVGRVYGDNATSRGLSVTRGAGYSYYGEGSGALTQTIYDWSATSSRVGAAQARENAALNSFEDAQSAVSLRAVQAYIAVVRSTELLAKATENLTAMQDYKTRIEAQVAEGGADEAELGRARDYLLLATNIKTEFDGQYDAAIADYIEAAGSAPDGGLTKPARPASLPKSLEDAIEGAKAGHPQVRAAQDAIKALGYDVDVEKVSALPVISGELSYLQRDQRDIIGGESTDGRALLKMNWNYSTGGAQKARASRAMHQKEEAQSRLDDVYRTLERNIRVAWSARNVATAQREAQEGRKAATAQVLENYMAQYEGSKKNLTDLMQAKAQAFDADIAYTNADYGVLNASYTLLASTGGLMGAIAHADENAAPVKAKPVTQEAGPLAAAPPAAAQLAETKQADQPVRTAELASPATGAPRRSLPVD